MKTVIMSRATVTSGGRVKVGDEVTLSDAEAHYFLSRNQCTLADPKDVVDAEIKGEIQTRKVGKKKASKKKVVKKNAAD